MKKQRTDDEIMQDIIDVYTQLSPENLSHDGELSRAQTRKRELGLNAKLRTLEREMGHPVTEEQAFSWERQ